MIHSVSIFSGRRGWRGSKRKTEPRKEESRFFFWARQALVSEEESAFVLRVVTRFWEMQQKHDDLFSFIETSFLEEAFLSSRRLVKQHMWNRKMFLLVSFWLVVFRIDLILMTSGWNSKSIHWSCSVRRNDWFSNGIKTSIDSNFFFLVWLHFLIVAIRFDSIENKFPSRDFLIMTDNLSKSLYTSHNELSWANRGLKGNCAADGSSKTQGIFSNRWVFFAFEFERFS